MSDFPQGLDHFAHNLAVDLEVGTLTKGEIKYLERMARNSERPSMRSPRTSSEAFDGKGRRRWA